MTGWPDNLPKRTYPGTHCTVANYWCVPLHSDSSKPIGSSTKPSVRDLLLIKSFESRAFSAETVATLAQASKMASIRANFLNPGEAKTNYPITRCPAAAGSGLAWLARSVGGPVQNVPLELGFDEKWWKPGMKTANALDSSGIVFKKNVF